MWMWPWERINLHKALAAMAAELDRNHIFPAKQYRKIAKSFVKRAADDNELRELIIGRYIHNMEWPIITN